MKIKAALFGILIFAFSVGVKAQVSPISGVGVLQLLDNTGAPATQGCYYFYVAGTSTQQATFTDSTGQTPNTNPLCLGSGARANGVWLTSSAQYKIVACLNNDGAFCNASDILWSQDFLPASSGGGGGSASCSSGCIGFFISGTASPSTSGVLRLASGDSFGWRNAAGSANLLFSKDANDILTWQGGDEKYSEINCPTTAPTGADLICADVTAHRFKIAGNGGSMQQAVVAGVDLNNSDQVSAVHFGASQAPFSSTLPSTNQFLQWNGTNIVGANPVVFSTAYLTSNFTSTGTGFTNVTGLSFSVAANTKYKITCDLDYQMSANGIQVQWTGPASPTFVTYDMWADLTTGSSTISPGVATAFSTALQANTVGATGVNLPLRLTMTLSNGANAGTVQLQAGTTGATATVTIIPGSCSMQQ